MSRVQALVVIAVATTLAGCTSGAANKAGGSKTPKVLTVGDSDSLDQPDTAAIQHFASQVDKLSHGSLRIRIVYGAGGSTTPYGEEHVIRAVQAGRFDLGWIGARAWDEVGVNSFRALQAPFLITSTHLLDRVATSPLAAEMLDSLSTQNVVGLALVPDFLRHPIGLTHKLTSPADFAGARIRIPPSRVSAALMRSLGAVPVEISNQEIGFAIDRRRVDAEELSFQQPVRPSIVTGNLVFFAKALTLYAGRRSFDGLSGDQRRVLRTVAAETVRHVIAHYPTDAEIVESVCANQRRLVLATAGERAELMRMAQPVYRMLEADPQTRRFIEQIRTWKLTTPPDPPFALSKRCWRTRPAAQATGAALPASLLNGTYRWVLTIQDARKGHPSGGPPQPGDFPMIGTAVLRDGKWAFAGADHDNGTYSIHRDRLRFVWPRVASTLVFRFTRDADGTLHLTPVPPMDEGDQFVWAYKPWKRIGPPTQLER